MIVACHRRYLYCFLLGGAIEALSVPALSQAANIYSLSLQDLMNTKVSVASRYEESVHSAPGVISVITREQIQAYQARNLGDVLNRIVGAQFLSPDVFMDQTLSMRAQSITPYNNHILILQNGRPIRDPITGGFKATLYVGFPLNSIDKIEIIRGPGSVLYGSTAFSGVINIITRDNSKNTITGGIQTGNYQQQKRYLDIDHQTDNWSLNLGFQHEQNDGPEYRFTDYEGTLYEDNFEKDVWGLTSEVTYQDLTANMYWSYYRPYSLNGNEAWQPGFVNDHETQFVDLTYSTALSDSSQINVSYTFNKHIWHSKGSSFGNSDSSGVSNQLEAFYQAHLANSLEYILGGGYEYVEWSAGRLVPGHQQSAFLYTQAKYQVNDDLSAIVGAQWNRIHEVKSNLSPRLGLIYQLNKKLTAKFLYSEAFRRGYPFETSFAVVVFRGNPELEPEEIKTYEVQLIHHTPLSESSLTYYHSKMENLITRKFFSAPESQPPFYLQYLNQGEWSFWGLEYEGQYKLLMNMSLIGNASYQQNKRDGIANAALHPSTLLKLGVDVQFDRWNASLFHVYQSKPYATTRVRSDSAIVNQQPQEAHLLSAKFSTSWNDLFTQKLTRDIRFSLEIDNLLDDDFAYPDYPNKGVNSLMPSRGGRTWHLGLELSF